VSLCLLPVLAVNSIPAAAFASMPPVAVTDVLGSLLHVGGLTFEVAADRQKSQWMRGRKEKKHNEEFLTRGLWSRSRHPNYFGESTLWTGIATAAAGVLVSGAGQAEMGFAGGLIGKLGALMMAGVSPASATFLFLKVIKISEWDVNGKLTAFQVSGVPMSERRYDKRIYSETVKSIKKRDACMFSTFSTYFTIAAIAFLCRSTVIDAERSSHPARTSHSSVVPSKTETFRDIHL
jgi:protein-S-isoprenylcysteine O-methyltransferase Ste14